MVRAGYGIFYGKTTNSTYYALRVENGIYQQQFNCPPKAACAPSFPNVIFNPPGPPLAAPFPGALPPQVTNTNPPLGVLATHGVANDFVNPLVHEGELTVERRLPGDLSLSVGYVFSRALHLPVFIQGNVGTFSGTDVILNPANIKQENALSELNQQHRFTGSVVWDPFRNLRSNPGRWLLKGFIFLHHRHRHLRTAATGQHQRISLEWRGWRRDWRGNKQLSCRCRWTRAPNRSQCVHWPGTPQRGFARDARVFVSGAVEASGSGRGVQPLQPDELEPDRKYCYHGLQLRRSRRQRVPVECLCSDQWLPRSQPHFHGAQFGNLYEHVVRAAAVGIFGEAGLLAVRAVNLHEMEISTEIGRLVAGRVFRYQSFWIITSVDFTTILTASPFFKPSSSALVRVITLSITLLPTFTTTWAMIAPSRMSSIVPGS